MIKTFLTKISRSENIFLYGCIFITLVFLLTRLQYFLYYPVLALSSDSASYCAAAINILEFRLTLFDIRTPGYPLFLSLVWFFSKSVYAMALMQSLLTFISSLFFLWVISRTYKSLTFLFAVTLCGYITSSYFILFESALLTEGVFTSLLIINSGLLILSLKENRTYSWILFSISVGMLIFVRPAALFLFAIIIFLVIFFFINSYKLKFYLSLILPCAILLICLCSYNYFTLKKFTITPFGEANLMGATILYMQPSGDYPAIVNEAIKNTLDSIPRKDISYVKNSSGISKLYHTFNDNFYRQINLIENLMKFDTTLTFVEVQPIIRKISIDAVKNHPGVYAKFFFSNFLFFFNNISRNISYYENLAGVYKRSVIDKKYVDELEPGRWRQVSSDKSDNEKVISFFTAEIENQKHLENVNINDAAEVELKPTILKSVFQLIEKIFIIIFRNILWIILYAVVFILSSYQLIKSRFKNIDALIPFLFCLIYLTKAILVSLVEVSLERYSYTVEYAVYFSLPFFILLLKNSKQKFQQIKL